MPSIAGFWSYAHTDDGNDEGRVLALAERLQAEYELLTAERLELFIDESALMWGDNWRERIAQALERVTFFIPVITPTYFRRPECRKELMRFAREAKEHRAEKLILPLYYVEVPELETDVVPADEAMAAVKPFQREDLRRLRLKNRDGAAYRRLVNGLANRLIEIAREAEEDSAAPHPVEPGEDLSPRTPAQIAEVEDEGDEDSTEQFSLEQMAKGEQALGTIQQPLQAISGDITVLGRLMRESTSEMQAADEAGKPGFASRLAIARKLATRLEEPAKRMEGHAKEYVSLLWDMDPFVIQLLDWAQIPGDSDDVASKKEFMKSVRELADVTGESSESVGELLKSLEENVNFSRDLRQPLRVYQTSLRNILDAQTVIDQWARRAEGAEESQVQEADGDGKNSSGQVDD